MRFWRAATVLAVFLGACEDPAAAPPVRPWAPGEAVDAAVLVAPRGQREYRGIVHLHSYISHDACDGHDRSDFSDEMCLDHLRDGICRTKQDFVYLTDHPASFADVDFPATLLYDPGAGDTLIDRDGKPAGNWLQCPDGRQVLVQAGFEASNVMAGGLYAHAGTDPAARRKAYSAETSGELQAVIDYGGALYLPHTEGKDFEWYAALPFDAQEIYNLHANVDPDIRETYLGLGPVDYLGDLLKFTSDAPTAPHPDLSFLSFYAPNTAALVKWDRLLPVRKIAGFAATDAHENVFTNRMRDGERGDSYRRLMSFFSNHIRTAGPLELDTPKRAIKALRAYVAFEALGVPAGFDFVALDSAGAVHEMGDDAPAGSSLVLEVPRVWRLEPAAAPPAIEGVIYRIDSTGRHEAARGAGRVHVDGALPGVYRAEVVIVPHHLRADLGGLADKLIRPYTWVYTNPIFVE